MYIPAPIVKSGFFFTPTDPTVKHPGTLTISEGGRAELEITTSKIAFTAWNVRTIGRLIGEVEGGFVTLEDCAYRKLSLSTGTPSKSTITASTVFDGIGFTSTPLFTSLDFCIDGLTEWLDNSAFNIVLGNSLEDTSITICTRDKIEFLLPMETKFEIKIQIKVPGRVNYPTIELFQQAYITLTPAKPETIEFFQKLCHQITRFFSFSIGKTVSIHSMRATCDAEDLPYPQNLVDLYFRSLNGSTKTDFSRYDMLLCHKDLGSRFPLLLSSWLNNYEHLKPALHHHYAVQDNSHLYADTKFLAIAQAIEALHRRTHSTTKWPKDEYKNKIASILDSCPKNEREWLNSKLAHGNEITLAERIHHLIDKFHEIFGGAQKTHQIVRGMVNTRNYHAHYDPKGESKALKDAPLIGLIYNLRALFVFSLLIHLGYTVDEVTKLSKSPYLNKMISIGRNNLSASKPDTN